MRRMAPVVMEEVGAATGRAYFCRFFCLLSPVLQIFEGVMNLLDRLKAWHSTPGSPGNAELKEMAQIGLRIITGYIRQQRSPVSFTQTTPPANRQH